MARLTGALLAGGISRRLGQAKCLLEFSGRPLGLHLLDRLGYFCDDVILLANDPTPFAGWGYQVVADAYPGCGPLAGLHAALSHAATATAADDVVPGLDPSSRPEMTEGGDVFLLACDLPFFEPRLGALMRSLLPGHDAVIPRRGEYLEPLCAAYSDRLLPAIAAQLQRQQELRMISVLPGFRVRHLEQREREAFGPDERLFLNINTCEDLERARELWARLAGKHGPCQM